jgi:hypothetical protein
MRTRATLQLGQKGTKRLSDQYGDQLICARYRRDDGRQRQFKAVESIIEEIPGSPTPITLRKTALVGVRVGLQEVELQLEANRWEMEPQAGALGDLAQAGTQARPRRPVGAAGSFYM